MYPVLRRSTYMIQSTSREDVPWSTKEHIRDAIYVPWRCTLVYEGAHTRCNLSLVKMCPGLRRITYVMQSTSREDVPWSTKKHIHAAIYLSRRNTLFDEEALKWYILRLKKKYLALSVKQHIKWYIFKSMKSHCARRTGIWSGIFYASWRATLLVEVAHQVILFYINYLLTEGAELEEFAFNCDMTEPYSMTAIEERMWGNITVVLWASQNDFSGLFCIIKC
jgi:hypothetical protein